jgi:alkanesulfonate monooxygenase
MPQPPISIRSPHSAVEVAWFAPLCDDDYEFLGHKDERLASTWPHCRDIALTADRLGYSNLLCPSSYQNGIDTWSFASALAPLTRQISLLTALRCGEVHPPMLARAVASLDHILQGRLTVNIISSDLPGEALDSSARYARSAEVIQILQQAWTRERIEFRGDFYNLDLPSGPARTQQEGGPPLYFGGYSPDALELCARFCDVYLMWPETEERLSEMMADMSARAAKFGRTLDFGLRVHVIVRETESEARDWARRLVSRLDDAQGAQIRARALDAHSLGVARQAEMRQGSDEEGFAEPLLWTGIGRARSGCGAALVGDPDQIVAKLQRYAQMGVRAFILSGYPHHDECELFARHVLPRLHSAPLKPRPT